ncbi:hypothetical protein ACP70R_028523 [Stipagrostis hirtigluma subsp. patula]
MTMHPCSMYLYLPILVLLLLLFSATSLAIDERGRRFIYNGFTSEELIMDGDVSMLDGLLQLSSGVFQQKGHAFYPYPLNLTSFVVSDGSSVPSFSTTFVFAIISPHNEISGHGLAFVLSSTNKFFDTLPGQYMGLVNNGNNSNSFLAIELDTIKNTEFGIIKGVASGLLYLHEDWEKVILHRDIKTSNVLLDSAMNARLGDFGTWGYIAPELARLGKATKATDVFAFGVLMMEVACGRRPIWVDADAEPRALADWVLAAWQGGSIIAGVVDPRLDDYTEEEMELVLKLGLLCSHPSPNVRPGMRLVLQYLQMDAALPAELQPDSYLLMMGSDVSQDEVHVNCQHAMSCPATTITDLSKGR